MSQNSTASMNEDKNASPNESISIFSAPKNVKFLIPLMRSGITSNESTLGVIESSTRSITHMKDIFPLNSAALSQKETITENNGGDTTTSSLLNSATVSSCFDETHHPNQNELNTSDNEQKPLLQNKDFDQK